MGSPSTAELPTIDRAPATPASPAAPPSRAGSEPAREGGRTPADRVRALGYVPLRRLLTGLVSGAFLLMMLAGQYFAPAHSDSVAQQNIVRSILGGQPSDLVVPVDNWWLHAPFYLLTSLLPAGATAHLLDVLLTHAVLLAGILVFTRTYLRELFPGSRLALVAAHLAAAWALGLAVYLPWADPVAPLGNEAAATIFLTPNHRNLETGVALLLLAWFASWAGRAGQASRRRTAVQWAAASLSLGALTYSDPFFLYTLAGSLVLACAVFWLTGRWSARRAAGVLSVLVGGAVVHAALSVVMRALGVHAIENVGSFFAPAQGLVGNLQNVLTAYLVMFRASPWGLPIGASVALVVLNAVLAVAVLAGVALAARSQFRRPDPVRLPALLFILIGTAAYAFSTLAASGPASFRYVFVPVLAALPFATESLVRVARANVRWRGVVLVVLCGGLLANVAVNASVLVRQGPLGTDRLYAANEAVVEAVEEAGYTKGYATFWNANVNTYLADREVLFLPVTSRAGEVVKYDFLVNTPDFDVAADRSFLYVAPNDVPLVHEGPPNELDPQWWVAAVGRPSETRQLPTGGTLLFYDRDIGADLPLWVPAVED
ncbi:hypothetical protein [Geodermatophilus telluris]|nr:hypothetical protein [Geodermatophilus telluris]